MVVERGRGANHVRRHLAPGAVLPAATVISRITCRSVASKGTAMVSNEVSRWPEKSRHRR